MDRLLKVNVLATSGRAVEAAGDVDTLLLDKTGTITFGNRMATEVIPAPGVRPDAAMKRGPDGLAGRRDAGRPLDRRAWPRNGPDRRAAPGRATSIRSPPRPASRAWTTRASSWRKGAVDAVYRSLALEPQASRPN